MVNDMQSPLINRRHSLYINGAWQTGQGVAVRAINPCDGRVMAEMPSAQAHDVQAAAQAAHQAFKPWSHTPSAQRAMVLEKFAAGLEARQAALVDLQMLCSGKPRFEAEIDVADAVATFRYYAQAALDLGQRQNSPVALPADAPLTAQTRFEPVGPVGMIVPWNFPLVTSAWKIAPALAAGCTVVLKTSEFTPLIELVYADIAHEMGLPPGVLNILTGGAEVGMALTANPLFAKLSFTGSNGVGSRVMAAAAARCTPVSLELGGKSAIVVFADADTEQAVDCIMAGIFYNAGQMCSATSRLVLDEAIADKLLARFVEKTQALCVAAPSDEAAQMGPITPRAQFDRVRAVLALAKADGLHCLTGGEVLDGPGHFVQPTVYNNVPTDHPVWRDEIFGPVLAVRTFDTEDEAIGLANDSHYGLVATVVTADKARGQRVAEAMTAGHVWINSPQIIYPHTAWGGFKQSGIGRELGPWGLSAFYGIKNISTAL